jgi:metal-dependent HD superfamily phosphatase/phosphodiesterase
MAIVGPELLEKNITASPLLTKAVKVLENDEEIQELLKMSNVWQTSGEL